MAYFEDLSDYCYSSYFARPGTKSVGWLARGHEFPTAELKEEILDLIWLYCSFPVGQMRGFHLCEFCPKGTCVQFERNGQRMFLGSAEIRVFALNGLVYAAPTLLYHYVADHHYRPPPEFLKALREGPRPPNQGFFDCLANLGLKCNKASGCPR